MGTARAIPVTDEISLGEPEVFALGVTEGFEINPNYERKQVTKKFNINFYLLGQDPRDDDDWGEDEDDNFSPFVGVFDDFEGYLNANIKYLREQHSKHVYLHRTKLEETGYIIIGQKLSITASGCYLVIEAHENEATYKARVRGLMLQEKESKKKAQAKLEKISTGVKATKVPKKLTAGEVRKLTWEARMSYHNRKEELSQLIKTAKKYGLVLPKEFEAWKG